MNALRILLAVLGSAVILSAQAPGMMANDAANKKDQARILVASALTVPDLTGRRTPFPLTREFPVAPNKKSRPAASSHWMSEPSVTRAQDPVSAAFEEFPALPALGTVSSVQVQPRPKAITYSHGYEVRAKIHKYASYATLPIFVSEAIIGQKLFNETTSSGSLRSAHSALAVGTAVLFGLNSVTGVWNMKEAQKNPSGRNKRLFHGILMLGADAGFVATGALAPHREHDGVTSNGNASTHRAVAFASMGVATVSYLYMLFAR